MRKAILILSFILSFEAFAGEVPEKFQNPIFNNKLYSGGNKSFSHDILITPTYITDYDNKYGNEVCQYITEDEKGILLKCKNAYDKENAYNSYEMFFIKYKTDFRQTNGGLYCYVWSCDVFLDEKGRQRENFYMTAELHLSEVNNCDEEKDYYKDFKPDYPKINCVEEFKTRGWDKYILGNLQ